MKDKLVFKSEEGRARILNHYDEILKAYPIELNRLYIDTDYGQTFVLEAGNVDKTPLLLFHGSCSNSAMWLADIAVLQKEYHIFAVDIIGEAGRSDTTRPDMNGDELSIWIDQVMLGLNIDKAVFIGNSLGGFMAAKYAVMFPEKVIRLILIAASGFSAIKPAFLFKSIYYSLKGEKGLFGLNKLIYGSDDIPDEVMYVSNMIMKNFNPRLGAIPVFTNLQLKKLIMPVMYVAGENDVTVDVQKTANRLSDNIRNISINIIKDNGHVVFGIMPEILKFLGEEYEV